MNDYFSIRRFFKLVSNDLFLYRKVILIAAIVLLIISPPYSFVIYVGGLIVTSMVFSDLHDRQKASLYLMLPCSNLERFLSKWFLTSIGYIFGTLALYSLFFLFNKQPFDLTQLDFWFSILKYMVFHSVILLGSITFKKYALLKTALFVWVFLMGISLFYSAMTFFNAFLFYPGFLALIIDNMFNGPWGMICLLVAPFCWYVTYLRLTEYELS
jgi:hypothetical protein